MTDKRKRISGRWLTDREAAMADEAESLIRDLFIARPDVKAFYAKDGTGKWHWTSWERPFDSEDFLWHLFDDRCLGTYLLNTDDRVKFMAFDLDLAKYSKYWKVYDIDQILELEEEHYEFDADVAEGDLESALHDPAADAHRWTRMVLLQTIRAITRAVKAEWGGDSMTIITGGGAHVLIPFKQPEPAADARFVGMGILKDLGARKRNEQFYDFGGENELTIEVFPKQDTLDGKQLGNLIRLPFGWHHEAGIRTYSIDPEAVTTPLWDFRKISSLGALRALAQSVGKT